MATPKSQRIVIWVIAIVMTVGTLGSFFIFLLPSSKEPLPNLQQEAMQKQIEEYQKQQAEAAKKHAESSKPLEGYTAEAFDASSATELRSEDLVVGEGKEVPAGATVTVNYFGWTPDGKIFDSSNQNGTVTPIDVTLKEGEGGVIKGWVNGLVGAHEGSVRKLTIPAADAYGEAGSPPNIAANTPLTFIVEVKAVK